MARSICVDWPDGRWLASCHLGKREVYLWSNRSWFGWVGERSFGDAEGEGEDGEGEVRKVEFPLVVGNEDEDGGVRERSCEAEWGS